MHLRHTVGHKITHSDRIDDWSFLFLPCSVTSQDPIDRIRTPRPHDPKTPRPEGPRPARSQIPVGKFSLHGMWCADVPLRTEDRVILLEWVGAFTCRHMETSKLSLLYTCRRKQLYIGANKSVAALIRIAFCRVHSVLETTTQR